jgi:hypothetical protein
MTSLRPILATPRGLADPLTKAVELLKFLLQREP